MLTTWIESTARGRLGSPVRAGMWAALVVGTHPIEANQEVWLEVSADDVPIGPLPAFWVENKGVNSFWHVPIPPQAVGVRLRYRSMARHGSETAISPYQDVVVRPNLPERNEVALGEIVSPEGLVGNRMMTVRVDDRGSTFDIYFPTVGLHSDVRPADGDLPQSRSNFRAIVGGLAVGRRLDWFAERLSWEAFQHYSGATNLLVTELKWRHGPIRVLATDFAAMGPNLPRTSSGAESPGQYLKRYRISNEGSEPRHALFGVYVQTEVNGGLGEPGLSWHDGDHCLLASNRGHSHANRKLARDSTVEFALALDERGEVQFEPTGPNEALLVRRLELPPGGTAMVDLLVSGAFTGWRGDSGTYEHWIRPALAWFRKVDLDQLEHETAQQWDAFGAPLPELTFPRPTYAVGLRRAALTAALHTDNRWGAIAAGFDRGLHAYCWPRDAIWTGGALDRAGHPSVGRGVFEWLGRVRGQHRPFAYWFQKYTIDGWPEWETPAVDQTALILWGLERHFRRTGDAAFVESCWPIIEQAAAVCGGAAGHPGLSWLDDLNLVSSAGIWDTLYGAFLYSNACVVAGLKAAVRLAHQLGRTDDLPAQWSELADRVWTTGILPESPSDSREPGLTDPETGRFLDARRLSVHRALWTDRPELLIERSASVDVSLLSPVIPFGLLPADDPRARRCAEAILRYNATSADANLLTRWGRDPTRPGIQRAPSEAHRHDPSSLATLWMARYLIRLGRETGEGRQWNRALALLDAVMSRLCPLGLAFQPPPRPADDPHRTFRRSQGIWDLQAMLIETMLDLAGLDYDVPARNLILESALPPTWPHIGLTQTFPCGQASYRLERPIGGESYRLGLETRLDHPVTLQIDLTCPGLSGLGPWQARPASPPPRFEAATSRLTWTVDLPAGSTSCEWSWGLGPRPRDFEVSGKSNPDSARAGR